MPFGFWVLGNCRLADQPCQVDPPSQMPFGFWVLGNPKSKSGMRNWRKPSQMPFGFWVLGNMENAVIVAIAGTSLKCLSAFGFWGTPIPVTTTGNQSWSQMAFGFWVLGNTISPAPIANCANGRLKCLSAFGFWGTEHTPDAGKRHSKSRLKCLSAFGFWGTQQRDDITCANCQVSNAFRLLGSGERLSS